MLTGERPHGRVLQLAMTSLQITAAQRNALYEDLLDHLSGIEAVWFAAEKEDWQTATRLAQEFSDDLRFIVDDLGFGDGEDKPIELKTPPDVLSRVLGRLHRQVETEERDEADERAEARMYEQRSQAVRETCLRLLASLEAG